MLTVFDYNVSYLLPHANTVLLLHTGVPDIETPNISYVIEQLKDRVREEVEDLRNIENLDEVFSNPSLQSLVEVSAVNSSMIL